MPNELVPINGQVIKNLKDKLPIFKEGNNRTTKGIMNAWVGSLHVDNMTGGLYVRAGQLHTILRMGSRSDGQYLVDNISKNDKISFNNEVYIPAYIVIGLLEKHMEGADLRKRSYLKQSESIFQFIRDASEVMLIQEEIRQRREIAVKKLKHERIKMLDIKQDELTNKKLVKATAEFSHIRKKTEYRQYAMNVYNGLIVNKETHEIITKANIHDEEELLDLCYIQEWDTKWYDDFIERFERK